MSSIPAPAAALHVKLPLPDEPTAWRSSIEHRSPLDAYELGFLPGFREDCGYQQSQSTQLDIPVGMLDNDFRNPDLERFVDRFFEHEPQVGVIGDVYERDDINDHVAAAREIQASYPEAELIIVPKSRTVIDAIPEDLVLGYLTRLC